MSGVGGAGIAQEVAGARAEGDRDVVGVPETAGVERQASAPDAVAEIVAQSRQHGDLVVETWSPSARQSRPVASCRCARRRERVEGVADLRQAETDALCHADEADAADHVGRVPAVPRRGSFGTDEALVLVEPEGGGREPTSIGHLADGEPPPDASTVRRPSAGYLVAVNRVAMSRFTVLALDFNHC